MKPGTKISAGAFAVLALLALSGVGQAQGTNGLTSNGAEANTDVTVNPQLDSNVNASSGGNVFDFSSGGGRNAPPAPGLPSFAGGPCMGVSGGVSASGPGFSIGGGRSFEDESCQRRNWVQTLIGVSQHMPEVEANELKRVAITLMMQDEFVGPAFEALGYDTDAGLQGRRQGGQGGPVARAAAAAATVPAARTTTTTAAAPARAQMQQGCVTLIPNNASPSFRALLEGRGCSVEAR